MFQRGDRVKIRNANGSFMKTDYGRVVTAVVRGTGQLGVEVDAWPTTRMTGWYAPSALVKADD